jgi:disulfide bond formation protein DsbB
MQVVLGEAPCPLCILQRYALLFIAVFAFIAAAMPGRRSLSLRSAGGAQCHWRVVAAGNHVYILANPMVSCGIDTLQPIVDDLPLAKPGRWRSRSMASAARRTRRSSACRWRNGHCGVRADCCAGAARDLPQPTPGLDKSPELHGVFCTA